MFIYMLWRNGSRFSGMAWPTARSIVSLLVAAFALKATGIAWAGDEVLPIVACLWRGIVLGIVGGSVYTGAIVGLWSLAGRPNGPERQIMAVIMPLISRVTHRTTALVFRKRFASRAP